MAGEKCRGRSSLPQHRGLEALSFCGYILGLGWSLLQLHSQDPVTPSGLEMVMLPAVANPWSYQHLYWVLFTLHSENSFCSHFVNFTQKFQPIMWSFHCQESAVSSKEGALKLRHQTKPTNTGISQTLRSKWPALCRSENSGKKPESVAEAGSVFLVPLFV